MTKDVFRGWVFIVSLLAMIAGGFVVDAGMKTGGTMTIIVGAIFFLAALFDAQDQPA